MSGEIDEGLFGKPKYSITSHLKSEDDIESKEIDNVSGRFNVNEQNFMEAFNFEAICATDGVFRPELS